MSEPVMYLSLSMSTARSRYCAAFAPRPNLLNHARQTPVKSPRLTHPASPKSAFICVDLWQFHKRLVFAAAAVQGGFRAAHVSKRRYAAPPNHERQQVVT